MEGWLSFIEDVADRRKFQGAENIFDWSFCHRCTDLIPIGRIPRRSFLKSGFPNLLVRKYSASDGVPAEFAVQRVNLLHQPPLIFILLFTP